MKRTQKFAQTMSILSSSSEPPKGSQPKTWKGKEDGINEYPRKKVTGSGSGTAGMMPGSLTSPPRARVTELWHCREKAAKCDLPQNRGTTPQGPPVRTS